MRLSKSPEDHCSHFIMDKEGQLINSEDLYFQVIENADGVPFRLIFGPHLGEGFFLNVGSGIKQLLGIELKDFSEKVFQDMIVEIVPLSDDIPSELSVAREKFIMGELKNYKAEFLLRLAGGEKKWIKEASLPLIDEETGRVIGSLGILSDINESKLSLAILERAKERAEESDHLKSAFLRNISHEIRTPLNAIVGFSALLSESEKKSDERQVFKDILLRSADHLLEIINNIVEISNIETDSVTVKKGLVNLDSTLLRIIERFKIQAHIKNISLRFLPDQNESDVRLFTDGFKLYQIITNLLDNALKFTEKGEVEFGYTIKGKIIKFYIKDTGIGISEKVPQMIFRRFYQAENSSTRRFEGTGLGLSISKAYVELLGGEIWFTSQPGVGSVFYFTLPYEVVEGMVML